MIYDIRASSETVRGQYDSHSRTLRALREHEAGIAEHAALATAVRRWLTAHHGSLIGDSPREAEHLLRAGEFDDRQFDHIIIDEFQDLTEIEARLVLGLRSPDCQVVALGDRKQSIYAFRGNVDAGLEALPRLVGEAVVDHPMHDCQRCREEVVNLANDVMAYYNEPLNPVRGPGSQVHQVHHRSPAAEAQRVAEEVVRMHDEYPDQRHLILATRRRWGYAVRDEIRRIAPGIAAQTVFSEDILETWPAREAFLLLSVVADPNDPVALRDWIGYRPPDPEGKNWKGSQRHAPAYHEIYQAGGVLNMARVRAIAHGPVSDLRGAGRGVVHARLQRLVELVDQTPINDPEAAIEYVLQPDRWLAVPTPNPDLARDDVTRLRTEVDRLRDLQPDATLSETIQALRNRIASREPLGLEDDVDVSIVTLWGAKGLTADFVYVVGLCDEALPGPYDSDTTGLSEEEHELEQRRLLYVTLTRAKRALVLSRPQSIQRGQVAALGLARRGRDGHQQSLSPCRFLADVDRGHLPDSVLGTEWGGIDVARLADA